MNNVHFAIPEIYGETLSYYELLRKLVDKTNELIDNYNTVPEQIAEEVKKLDSYSVFTTAMNWVIHSIATDNTKSKDAVKQYKKHDLLYATFNDTVNLYEAITDFTNVFLTELKVGENIREVNISELFIELRKLIDINKNNIEQIFVDVRELKQANNYNYIYVLGYTVGQDIAPYINTILDTFDTCYIPQGEHVARSTLNIPSSKCIKGEKNAILKFSTSSHAISIIEASHVQLENLTIINDVTTASGIYVKESKEITFKGVTINNFNLAIDFYSDKDGCAYNTIDGCHFYCVNGIRMKHNNSGWTNFYRVLNTRFSNIETSNSDTFFIDMDGTDLYLYGCDLESSTIYYKLKGDLSNSCIISNHFEGNSVSDNYSVQFTSNNFWACNYDQSIKFDIKGTGNVLNTQYSTRFPLTVYTSETAKNGVEVKNNIVNVPNNINNTFQVKLPVGYFYNDCIYTIILENEPTEPNRVFVSNYDASSFVYLEKKNNQVLLHDNKVYLL